MTIHSKIRDIVTHASTNVPYYWEIFKKMGWDKNTELDVDLFRQIPLLDRSTVSKNSQDFLAENMKKEQLIRNYTSGSTGTPLMLYKDKREVFVADLLLWNTRKRFVPNIASLPMLRFYLKRSVKDGFISDPYYFDDRGVNMSLLHLDRQTFDDCWSEINKRGINELWIFGSPSAMLKISQFYRDSSYQGKPAVKYIELASEVVFPDQQQFIRQTFGCPVMNQYGSAEFWGIAYECESGNLHLYDKHIFLEIVDADGSVLSDGREGEIIVTGLDNYAMPFIRYRIGDTGKIRRSNCACGNHSDILELTGGRVTDYILTQNGQSVNSILIYYIVSEINLKKRLIHQFRATQISLDEFIVQLSLTDKSEQQKVEDIFRELMCKHLGASVNVRFECKDDISGDQKAGKFKYFDSQIKKANDKYVLNGN